MMRTRTLWRAVIVLLTLVFSLSAFGNIRSENVFYYYDESARLDFQDIIESIDSGKQYEEYSAAQSPVGVGNHWIFLFIDSQGVLALNEWLLEIRFPNIDRVEALVVYDNGVRERFFTGDEVAFEKWPVAYRKPTIPLRQLELHGAAVYFKIKSDTPLIFPLALQTRSDQIDAQRAEHFLYGLFYGSIFILVLYNAGIYFSLRDKSYRFYILYMLSFSLVQASTTGLGQQYLWPSFDNVTTRLALLAIILTNYFMIQFVIHFLDIKSHRSDLVFPLRCLAILALLLAPTLLLPNYAYPQFAIHGLNIVSMVAIVYITLSIWKSNPRSASYLLLSYSVLFSAIGISLLFQAGLVEHYSYIDYSMSAAILFEAIVLSIGLSEKIARLRMQKEESERGQRVIQEQLSQQLIQAREHERAEMSRLLHDSVSHNLVVVQRNIGNLWRGEPQSDGESEEKRSGIDRMLSETIHEIRNISHLAHPQIVKYLGLEMTLQALLEATFDSSITWNLHIEDIPLSYEVQLLLYRAVQESTTNIIRHADASECLIQLKREGSSAVFILKDDGKGFDAAPQHWRFGLRTLNEHCKSVSGTLRVSSAPEEGTKLTITLPVML